MERDLSAASLSPRLVEALLPLYEPCSGFQATCREMRWDPGRGHVPRGYCGATGDPAEVRLALVFAEPGDPYADEDFSGHHEPAAYVHAVHRTSSRHKARRVGLFEQNLWTILDFAWPGVSYEAKMRRTWITDSVLCSAPKEGGSVRSVVARACIGRHLVRQLQAFPNLSRVVAVGSKASKRLTANGIPGSLARLGVDFAVSGAAAPPGCHRDGVRESWRAAVAGLDA